MVVRHKATGKDHTISQEDWEILERENHAKNFEVIQAEDFVPEELSLPPKKEKAKE